MQSQQRLNYEIIVVDNNSPHKKLYEVENRFKQTNLHFFYLEKNLGFGKGNNFAFSKASGEYICFLNPDTIVNDEIFSKVMEVFETDNSIGIIGPRQQTRKPFFDFSAGYSPNIFFELINLFGIGVFVEGFILYCITKLLRKRYFKVKWILGAAIFIKANLFKSVDGFDKDYFMFFEEVDLCKRVTERGYKVVYYPKLRIHHIGSVSGKKDYRLYSIRTYSSKAIYISKHYGIFLKLVMKILLYAQIFSQIIIWSLLFWSNQEKSKQKLSAFFYLLKNKMKYEHRD